MLETRNAVRALTLTNLLLRLNDLSPRAESAVSLVLLTRFSRVARLNGLHRLAELKLARLGRVAVACGVAWLALGYTIPSHCKHFIHFSISMHCKHPDSLLLPLQHRILPAIIDRTGDC
jgi:hypothetical protein